MNKRKRKGTQTSPRTKKRANEEKDANNLNREATDLLRQLGKIERENGNRFKSVAYYRAANVLEKHPTKISTVC